MDFRYENGVHVSYTPHNQSYTRCIFVTDTLSLLCIYENILFQPDI